MKREAKWVKAYMAHARDHASDAIASAHGLNDATLMVKLTAVMAAVQDVQRHIEERTK